MNGDTSNVQPGFMRALLLGCSVLMLGLVFEWSTRPTVMAAAVTFGLGVVLLVLLPRRQR